MAKAIIVELTVTIPDTEQGKDVTVTIEDRVYIGKVSSIITYTPLVPPVTSITISGPGLNVEAPAPP